MPSPPDPALPQADLHLLSPLPERTCHQYPRAGDTGLPACRQGLPASSSQYSLQRLNVKPHPHPPALPPTGPGRTCPSVSLPPKRVPSCLWDDGDPFYRMALCHLHRDISKKRGDQHSWPLWPTQPKRLLQFFKGSCTLASWAPREGRWPVSPRIAAVLRSSSKPWGLKRATGKVSTA